MKRKNLFSRILLLVLLLAFLPGADSGEKEYHDVWAIKDCSIHVKSGKVLDRGTIIIRNGLIEKVGTNIKIPADAEIIEGENLHVYPGFIDVLSNAFMKKAAAGKKVEGKKDNNQQNKTSGILPAYDKAALKDATMKKFHAEGFTLVNILSEKGIFTGTSDSFILSSTEKEKAYIKTDKWLGISFVPNQRSDAYPASLMGVVAYLRQAFTDAAYYNMHDRRWTREMKNIPRPVRNKELESILPFALEKQRVVFLCKNYHDIKRAIDIAKTFKLNYLIADLGGEAFRIIPELKKNRATVITGLTFKPPLSSIYVQQGKYTRKDAEENIYPPAPAKLAEAGIDFAFTGMNLTDPSKFTENVKKAISKGLTPERAVRAITEDAARILGIEKAAGTLESGKIANVIVSEGKIWDKESKIKFVFVDGQKHEMKKKKGGKPSVNVTGKWELVINTQMGAINATLDLKQEGAAVSGKLVTQFGTTEFTDGGVDGNTLSVDMTLDLGGRSMELSVIATIEGESMSGSFSMGTMGSSEFTGKKIPAWRQK